MINVLCVKLGDAYDSKAVNRLLKITKKYLSVPFRFFCYTENSEGFDSEIITIPFQDNGIKIVVHNKLALFSNYVEDFVGDGDRLYFDLDMVFCSNLDSISRYCTDHLTLIDSAWRIPVHLGHPMYQHNLNSSCMTWKRSIHTYAIWNHYIENKQRIEQTFHMGMDPFLYYEFLINKNSPAPVSTFPHGLFMSHLWGVDVNINRKVEGSRNGKYASEDVLLYRKNFPVILLNGPTTERDQNDYDSIYSDSISSIMSCHIPS